MNDYTGKVCPYCKTAFVPGDDIVLCSACDMPHHKDCWIENRSCTTFGCLGTIKTTDNTVSSVTTTQMHYGDYRVPVNNGAIFCSHCGTQNIASSSFCSRCGQRLAAAPQSMPQPPVYAAPPAYTAPQPPVYTQAPPVGTSSYHYAQPQNTQYAQQIPSYGQYTQYPPQNGYQGGYRPQPTYPTVTIDFETQQLIGTKSEYYVPKFQSMKAQNSKTSWNWAAFLVTPYWMMYRKMYGYAAIVLAAEILLTLIYSTAVSLLILVGYITFGLLGNNIYMNFLEGKAAQAKTMVEPYKSQFIAQNGGVNSTVTALTLVARIVLMFILLA